MTLSACSSEQLARPGAMAAASASLLLRVAVQRTNVAEAQERAQAVVAELAALRQTHRIAIAANGEIAATSATAAPAEDRLRQVRNVLAEAPFIAAARANPWTMERKPR